MAITYYVPAPVPANEAARSKAVAKCRLTEMADDFRLRSLVELAATYVGTPMAAVTVVQGVHHHMIATFGVAPYTSARSASFCGHAILRPDSLLCVPDALLDERFAGKPDVLEPPAIRFYAAAPLVSRDHHGIGTLCVFSSEPRPALREDEAAVLRALAERVMMLSGDC